MTYRVRNIGIAVALAAVAALLVSFYVTNYKRHLQRGESHVSVLVAARDIPAGTPGSQVVGRHMLKTETVVQRAVVPGAISSPDQIEKLVSLQAVYAGEQVTTRRFGQLSQRGIRSLIKGNERALQVPGDANQLLAGTLRNNDRVDVVATWTYPEGSQQHFSRVILRNLLVLKAPGTPSESAKLASSQTPLSAQLAMTDSQSQKLFWQMKNGEWWLELRPPVNSQDSPNSVEDAATLLADGFTWPQLQKQLVLFGGKLR